MTIAAATHTNGLIGALPLFALLLAGAALLRWNRRSKAAAIPRIAQLERELDLIKSQNCSSQLICCPAAELSR